MSYSESQKFCNNYYENSTVGDLKTEAGWITYDNVIKTCYRPQIAAVPDQPEQTFTQTRRKPLSSTVKYSVMGTVLGLLCFCLFFRHCCCPKPENRKSSSKLSNSEYSTVADDEKKDNMTLQ